MAARVKQDRGAWWVFISHAGKRRKQRFGPTKADKRQAERYADAINVKIAAAKLDMAGMRTEDPIAREKRGRVALPFDRVVRDWLVERSPTFKPSYRISAGTLIEKHLVPFFGSMDLREIGESEILGYIRAKLGQDLSVSTIKNGLTIVRRVFNLQIRAGHLEQNPAARMGELLSRVDRSRATETQQVESWTREEVEALLGLAYKHEERFAPALELLFSTGLRRGELLGLKWEDVDLSSGRLNVRRAIVVGQLTTPKSGQGRTIALPASLVRSLRSLLTQRRRECLKKGLGSVPEWIFCTRDGKPLQARNFERTWYRLRRRAQAKSVRPFRLHATRHTYASHALGAGKSVAWVAAQLGHAKPETTLRVYAHALREEESDLTFAEFGTQDAPMRTLPKETLGSDQRAPS